MQLFYRGIAVLVIAAFISELVEFFVNMILARELGEMGMGQYMTILPSIFLIVIIASLELPISLSKYIAEKDEQYHQSMLGHAFRLVIIFTIVILFMTTTIVITLPVFQTYHPWIKWLFILFIPIVSFSSIAKGYFIGIQQMKRIAIANLLRKIGQLILLIIVFQAFDFQLQTAVFISLCALFGSELLVFVYFIHAYYLQTRNFRRVRGGILSRQEVRKNLLAISIPTTAMQIFHALTHAVQPFLIRSALIKSGLSVGVATEQFGMMAGVAMTIGFFPAFIAHSLLIILIPTVSKAYAEKQTGTLHKLLQQVLLLTVLYGAPAMAVVYFFAEPLTGLFFESTKAAMYLQLLWPYFFVHFFVIPMQAFLFGLGLVKEAFFQQIWSTFISFSLIFLLGSSQHLGMAGVIIGMNTGIFLLMLMHYVTIKNKIGFTLFNKNAATRYH